MKYTFILYRSVVQHQLISKFLLPFLKIFHLFKIKEVKLIFSQPLNRLARCLLFIRNVSSIPNTFTQMGWTYCTMIVQANLCSVPVLGLRRCGASCGECEWINQLYKLFYKSTVIRLREFTLPALLRDYNLASVQYRSTFPFVPAVVQ